MASGTSKKSKRKQTASSRPSSEGHQTRSSPSPNITLQDATPTCSEVPWSSTPSSPEPRSSHLEQTQSPSEPSSPSSTISASSTESLTIQDQPDQPPSIPRPLLPKSRSTAHLTTFAPPFYNRPPTPLPPSPSLTSLLRPSFSTTTSRPGTPTDSDAEGPGSASTVAGASEALLSPASIAQPVPRASPKVPTYEYYGFVLYLTSSLFFLGHILWSFLPSPFLHQLGIYYYPDRWWSLAIPAWLVMAVVFIYVGLSAYNVEVLTLPMGSLGGVVDEVGVVAVVDQQGRLEERFRRRKAEDEDGDSREWRWKDVWNESTDAVLDVPIGGVCEVLYAEE